MRPVHNRAAVLCLAEGVGFEPTVTCATHAFQACRFGRSRTPPGAPKFTATRRADLNQLPLSCCHLGRVPGLECDGRVLCNASP